MSNRVSVLLISPSRSCRPDGNFGDAHLVCLGSYLQTRTDARVELIDSEEYGQERIVRDPLQLEVLALRLNPGLSTLMMAENIKRNLQTLSDRTGQEPGRTELYLAHFLGADAAVTFLKTLDEEPATIASDIFPKQAAMNPGVFQNRKRQPRTVAGVYRWFDSKFNTVRYDERNPG